MDRPDFNESLSLTDGIYEAPTMSYMLFTIRRFASEVLQKDVDCLDELWRDSHLNPVIPGTSSKDLAKLGTKPEVCELFQEACTTIFYTLLPGLKKIYLDSRHGGGVKAAEVPVKQNTPESSVELVEMQREVIRLQKEVLQLKDQLHSAEKSAFSTTVRKELQSYSAVLTQNCAAAVAPKKLQTALRKATAPVEEDVDRSKNLMVFGLPETEDEGSTSTTDAVSKVFAHLEVSPAVASASRLGTKTSTRARPVKVSLEKREDLLLLLKRARQLRQSDCYRRVYLSPDLSREEREDSSRLHKTLKQLRLDNPGRKYWVKGGAIMVDV